MEFVAKENPDIVMLITMGGSKPRQAAVKGDYDLVQGVSTFLAQASP